MPELVLRLFGPPRLERGGMPLATGLRRGLALAAYLAVSRQPQSREKLAALLWPEEDGATARGRLRRTLHELNHRAGADIIVAQGDALAIDPGSGLRTDLAEFRRLATSPDADDLAAAAEVGADEFLSGLVLDRAGDLDAWIGFQRETLRQDLADVLGRLDEARAAAGDLHGAISAAQRRLALDPLQEPVHRRLMELYARAGQPAAALRQYETLVRLLDEELGTAPAAETAAAFRAIGLPPTPQTGPAGEGIPPVRFTRSGPTLVAYQVIGDGPVDVIMVPGFVSHLEHAWKEPQIAGFYRRIGRRARLVPFDRRGLGLSERVGPGPTPDNTQADLGAVLDAVGSRRAVLLGVSEGGPACAAFAARHPDRVAGLVLYGTLAKGSRAADFPHAAPAALFDLFLDRLVADWGGPVSVELFAPGKARDEGLRRWAAEMVRLGSSPAGLRTVLEALRDTDVRGELGRIRAPTLVLHRTGDQAIRIGCGRDLAARIPGARLVELPGEDHWWWVGDTDAIADAVEDFLDGLDTPAPRPVGQLLAVLALSVPPGQAGACEARVLGAGGRLLPTGGDGPLLAAFPAVSLARDAASAVVAAGGRAAIDAGECQPDGAALAGPALTGAAALLAEVGPGEVRLSPLAAALLGPVAGG